MKFNTKTIIIAILIGAILSIIIDGIFEGLVGENIKSFTSNKVKTYITNTK